MTYEGIVRNGMVRLPEGVNLPDGTVVRIEPTVTRRFGDLLDLAGTWAGDDADRVVAEIYATRTSSEPRVRFDP